MRHLRGLFAALLIFGIAATEPAPSDAAPEGQMTWAVHISLAPTWFDPAETPGIGTPFMVLYALHDALVKPMPGNAMAPSLAESWSLSKDGLVYEFVLRQGAKFHNGDPVTADDVKFSFERYRGAASKAPEGPRRGDRDRGRAPGALPAQGALARLHDLLREPGHRRRLDRAPEVRRSRSATTASRRRPWGRVPTGSSRSPRASSWCWRPTSNTGGRSRA